LHLRKSRVIILEEEYRYVNLVRMDVSEEHIASIIIVGRISVLRTMLAVSGK
jgi:hypothetical protein